MISDNLRFNVPAPKKLSQNETDDSINMNPAEKTKEENNENVIICENEKSLNKESKNQKGAKKRKIIRKKSTVVTKKIKKQIVEKSEENLQENVTKIRKTGRVSKPKKDPQFSYDKISRKYVKNFCI